MTEYTSASLFTGGGLADVGIASDEAIRYIIMSHARGYALGRLDASGDKIEEKI